MMALLNRPAVSLGCNITIQCLLEPDLLAPLEVFEESRFKPLFLLPLETSARIQFRQFFFDLQKLIENIFFRQQTLFDDLLLFRRSKTKRVSPQQNLIITLLPGLNHLILQGTIPIGQMRPVLAEPPDPKF